MDKQRIFQCLLTCALSLGSMGALANPPEPHHQNTPIENKFDAMQIRGDETLLQFGGTQHEAYQLASLVPYGKVIGVEATPSASTKNHHQANLSFEKSRVDAAETKDRFDRIFIQDAFTKNPKQQTLLNHLTAQLKPNGQLVMFLPNYKEGYVGKALKETWLTLHENVTGSPSYLLYNSDQYKQMIEKTGLKVETSKPLTFKREFANLDQFKNWLVQNWGYYQEIAAPDQALFLQVFLGNYLDFTHQDPKGRIVWEEEVLNIEAKKFA